MSRCEATTKKGERCKRAAVSPEQFCTMHLRALTLEPEPPPVWHERRRLLIYGGTPERWAWECPYCGRKALEQGGTTGVEHDCPSLPAGVVLHVMRQGRGPKAEANSGGRV